jgi:hypothetical protein
MFRIDRFSVMFKLTKISYIGTFFKVQFIKNSILFRVWYMYIDR